MRISDERYQRDLRRLQLAWRMIQLGARTPMIARWTALPVLRIRRLRREYAADLSNEAILKGVTPTRVEFFWKSATLRWEAPLLAGFLRQFDVLPLEPVTTVGELFTLARGERFCSAYEQFCLCCPRTEISIEHALMLLSELARGVEIAIDYCSNCGELVLDDRLFGRPPRCAYCLYEAHTRLSPNQVRTSEPSAVHDQQDRAEEDQGSLF